MTEHFCQQHPDGEQWLPGEAINCPYHKKNMGKSLAFKWGRKARRSLDKEVGVVGVQQTGYIDG